MGNDDLSQLVDCLKETGLKVGVIRQAIDFQTELITDLIEKTLKMQWIWDGSATRLNPGQTPTIIIGTVNYPLIPHHPYSTVDFTALIRHNPKCSGNITYFLTNDSGMYQYSANPDTEEMMVTPIADVGELVHALSRHPTMSALEQVRTNILLAIEKARGSLETQSKELDAMVAKVAATS